MKRTFKTIAILFMAVTILMGVTMHVFAATRPNFPYHSSNQLDTNGSWKVIASSSEGFSCRIVVAATTRYSGTSDILMLGRNGEYIWSENAAVTNFYPRSFDCGSDVYQVLIRTTNGEQGFAWAGYVEALN